MIDKLVICFILTYSSFIFSQSQIGFIDQYSGVNAVLYNPATIADNPLKEEYHLFSTSFDFGNNVIPINPFQTLRNPSSLYFNGHDSFHDYVATFDFKENSTAYLNVNIQGPSYVRQLDRLQSIAVFTNVRLTGFAHQLNSKIYASLFTDALSEDTLEFEVQDFTDTFGQGNVAAWAELGFSYAKVLYHKPNKLLKGGITFKFLKGLQSGHYQVSQVTVQNDQNLTDLVNNLVENDFNINSTNSDVLWNADLTTDYEYASLATNYGNSIDIGFVYEHRNKTLPKFSKDALGVYYIPAPYHYKISAAITDIGFLNFNQTVSSIAHIAYTYPNEFDIDETTETVHRTYATPMTAHVNLDYHIRKRFFVNGNLDVYMLPRNSVYTLNNVSSLTISPRYESYQCSFFAPISINQYGVVRSGIGFRTPYFYINSATLISNFTNFSKEVAFEMGIKIAIKNKNRAKEFNQSLKHHQITNDALNLK